MIKNIEWAMKRKYIDAAKSPWYEIILVLIAQRTPFNRIWAIYEGWREGRMRNKLREDYPDIVEKQIHYFEPSVYSLTIEQRMAKVVNETRGHERSYDWGRTNG